MEDILKLIKTVHPLDADALDELNARVQEYISGHASVPPDNVTKGWWENLGDDGSYAPPRFATSRDALKAIRPEYWQYRMIHDYGSNIWNCFLQKWGANCTPIKECQSGWHNNFKTEELAELHAIIRAIAYERGQQ